MWVGLKLTSDRKPSEDKLFNVEAAIPPRPTISNLQWIAGTQYVSPADMDLLSKSSTQSDTVLFLLLSFLLNCYLTLHI